MPITSGRSVEVEEYCRLYGDDPVNRSLYDRVSGFIRDLLQTDVEIDYLKKVNWRFHDAKEAIEYYNLFKEYRVFHNWVSELLDELLDDGLEEPKAKKKKLETKEQAESETALHRYICDLDYRMVHDRICHYVMLLVKSYYYSELVDVQVMSQLIDEVLKPVASKGASKFNRDHLRRVRKMSLFDTMFPHDIIRKVHLGPVGEFEWKVLLEDFGTGKFKRWVAVCDIDDIHCISHTPSAVDVSVAFGLFVADLAEEPWKGKVINYSKEPRMYSLLRGGIDDVKSKCKIVREMDRGGSQIDFEKVYDLILETAVKKNLKPKQMVKKVLVLSPRDFDAEIRSQWQTCYAKIQSKYEEKGYAVPDMVYWALLYKDTFKENLVMPRILPGVKALRGFSNIIIFFFLRNHGRISTGKFRRFFHLAYK